MLDSPAPFDHVRAGPQAPVQPGIYRVVGTGEGVRLLRVADGDGARRHTGEVVSVTSETYAEAFESAENPDTGFSPMDIFDPFIAQATAIPYWLRRLVGR